MEEQPLLPTFKKKRGPKPKYGSLAECKKAIAIRHRKKLRENGIARLDLKVPQALADVIKAEAKDSGKPANEVALAALQKIFLPVKPLIQPTHPAS